MKLKVARVLGRETTTKSTIKENNTAIANDGIDKRPTRKSSSSKLKALIKNGKDKALKMKQHGSSKVLIKVLPKNPVTLQERRTTTEKKEDYETDSSSQDHVPLLAHKDDMTHQESDNNSEEPACQLSMKQTIPTSPQQEPRGTHRGTHRGTQYIPRSTETANEKVILLRNNLVRTTAESTTKEPPNGNDDDLARQLPKQTPFPSDISCLTEGDKSIQNGPKINWDQMNEASKAALFKALHVGSIVMEKGSNLCAATCPKSYEELGLPCRFVKPSPSIDGTKSASSIIISSESTEIQGRPSSTTTKRETPAAVDDGDCFLVTMEDTKDTPGIDQVQDVMGRILGTSLGKREGQGTEKNPCFIDEDMEGGDGTDEASPVKTSNVGWDDSSDVVQEIEGTRTDDEDSEEDDQSNSTAKKVVRYFRPEELICTENLVVAYGGNAELSEEGAFETVLVIDDNNYENKNWNHIEAHSEYGDPPSLQKIASYAVGDAMEGDDAEELHPIDVVYEIDHGDDEFSCMTTPQSRAADDLENQSCWYQLDGELGRLQTEYQGIMEWNNDDEINQKWEEIECKSTYTESQMDDPHEETYGVPQGKATARMKIFQGENTILKTRVQELVKAMKESELSHSSQLTNVILESNAIHSEMQNQQESALDAAASKIQELETSLQISQTQMVDIRAKYNRDLEAAKVSQTIKFETMQRNEQQNKSATNAAAPETFNKIQELESSLLNTRTNMAEMKVKTSQDLEAAQRMHAFQAAESKMVQTALRKKLVEVQSKAVAERTDYDRTVRELREEHSVQIEKLIAELDQVVAEHEKDHAKEIEKLIAQLDLVLADREAKTSENER